MSGSASDPVFDSTPDSLPLLLAAAGALLGLGVALLGLTFWHPEYVSYDGIVGPPAVLGYAPIKKMVGYLALVFIPWLAALGLSTLLKAPAFAHDDGDRRSRASGQGASMIIAAGASFAGVALAALAIARWEAPRREALLSALTSPSFVLQFLVLVGCAAWLARVPGRDGDLRPMAKSGVNGAEIVVLVLLVVVLGLFDPLFGAGYAIGLIPVWLAIRRDGAKRLPNSSTRSILGVSALYVATPLLCVPLLRIMRIGVEIPPVLQIATLAAAGLTAVAVVYFGRRPKIVLSPLVVLPFIAFGIYRGSGGLLDFYDPYHQGEYIYPGHAMASGLAPFRDVFFVHGLGFNTLAPAVLGDALRAAPNLDIFFWDIVTAAGVGLMAWFYLRHLGARWWLLALVLALATAGGASTKSCRMFTLYIVVLLIGRALDEVRPGRPVRLRYIVIAGAVAAMGCLYSLDTGAVAVVAGLLWSALWGWFGTTEPGRGDPGRNAAARLRPLAAFAGGLALAGMPILAWLAAAGLLGDFFSIHIEYARMKSHYDNLPLPTTGLLYALSPALSVLAGVFLVKAFRSEAIRSKSLPENSEPPAAPQDPGTAEAPAASDASSAEPLPGSAPAARIGMILLLALMNFALFARGLDRSDAGHLVYANLMAWPLLACLIAWRARLASTVGVLARSAVLIALLIALPRTTEFMRGPIPMIADPAGFPGWYAANAGLPAALPLAEMDDPFFGIVAELESVTAPGDHLLDMTNRPAIYYWTHLKCPTRFFAAFYAAPESWQREIIERLEATQTPWVLWPGSPQTGSTTDGIAIETRHRLLSEYIELHYEDRIRLTDGSILRSRLPRG